MLKKILTADQVADYLLFIDSKRGDDAGISNLKLQKLLYYAQGHHLAVYGNPLFEDRIEAWEHGPVVVDVYHKHKKNKSNIIPFEGESLDLDCYPDRSKQTMNVVLEKYGQFSAWKLRDKTHHERPWENTSLNCTISERLIEDFFKEEIAKEHGDSLLEVTYVSEEMYKSLLNELDEDNEETNESLVSDLEMLFA